MSLNTFVTLEHLNNEIRATKNFDIAKFRTHLKSAAEKYLYNPLSEAFYKKIINDEINDDTVKSLTREALISFGAELYYDIGLLNIDDAGISESTPTDQKPARLEVLSVAQSSRADIGHRKIDLLLSYLESKADDFPDWKNSEAYTVLHEFPISTTKEFDSYCRIRESRSIFLALKPAMRQAMILEISPILAAKGNATTLTDPKLTQVNQLIKNALANYAYAYGIFDLATTFGFDMILSFSNLNASRQKGYEKVAKDMLESVEKRKMALAQASAQKALEIITENTPVQQLPEETPYKNDPNSHVFYL
jgi:hypothetical protein